MSKSLTRIFVIGGFCGIMAALSAWIYAEHKEREHLENEIDFLKDIIGQSDRYF